MAADELMKQQLLNALRSVREGILVNYLGLPAAPKEPAYLILVQEPTPGALPDRAPSDEEHHRLANGDVLHVSVWKHDNSGKGGKLSEALVGLPEADGWTQLLAGSSSPTKAP